VDQAVGVVAVPRQVPHLVLRHRAQALEDPLGQESLEAVRAVEVLRADRGTLAQLGTTYSSLTIDREADPSCSSSSSIAPSYGGGRYYGGGSASAYRSGGRSPAGLLPFALAGGALAFFPGLFLYGAYAYNYNHDYSYHNRTNTSQPANQNETLPVVCLCDMYSACGCDDNNNSTYLDSVVGNGSMADANNTLVHIAMVNGTKKLVLNGTLPNGTDNSTTTDNSTSAPPTSTGLSIRQNIMEVSGFWLVGAIVGATVWFL